EQKNTLSILDRAVAIQTAYRLAKAHDTVLIAGKGHETFQEVRGIRHPFSDEATVRALIAE
ncbi:MAG: UDP-N-acetylmuramoyl-L-alanyl-D-glutamate--2,6-diaminopimelate ligase, partial [Bacteroidota bacterium]